MTSPSPRLSWADLRGRRVGVFGLGIEGNATLRRLHQLGLQPVLVDDSPDSADVVSSSDGGLDLLAGCDVVIKTPGISRHRPDIRQLVDSGVAIVVALGLWLEQTDPERVIGITGTKGKSTTSAIAAHLLARLGHDVLLAGNIGVPPYDPDLDGVTSETTFVVELSSYHTADLTCAPSVVGLTSLDADHLDWHGSPETYVEEKLRVCRLPGCRRIVANGESNSLRSHAGHLTASTRWVESGDPELEGSPPGHWTAPLHLVGLHHHRDALIARALLLEAGFSEAADDLAIERAAEGFAHLPARLQEIGVVEGVTFIDDGLSTNVLSTVEAVSSMPPGPVALIAGGFDRGIDYRPLAEFLVAQSSKLDISVVTIGDAGTRLADALRSLDAEIDIIHAANFDAAVDAAFAAVRGFGVVLLSPSAPSFGEFVDYKARSAAFSAALMKIVERSPGP